MPTATGSSRASPGSTGGFSLMLCALKALLEHGVVPTAVGDRFPAGLHA